MEIKDRRLIALATLLSGLCIAYFRALDHWVLSSRVFAPIFKLLLLTYDAQTAWLSAAVCLAAAFWTKPAPILALVDFIAAHIHWVVIAGIAAFALGSVFVYDGRAFSMDEYAAVFQAKIFASGNVSAQLPAAAIDWLIPRGFNGTFLVASRETGRAIEGYWPGFALVLAPFEALQIPWFCNALLGGVALYLIYGITTAITGDRRAAGWAVLFTLASGVFAADAISYYSMQAHMTANLLFAGLLLKPTRERALAAGCVGSIALVLHNPVPHTLFAAPWILAMARSREQRKYLIPLILGYLPLSIVLGGGWLLLRGAIAAGNSGFNTIGADLHAVFRLPDLGMVNMRVASSVKLLLWAVPGLFVFAAVGAVRHRVHVHVRLLTQSAILTFIGYLFVDLDQGHGWGYRYFHSAWGVVPILAACALAGRSEPRSRLVSFAGAAAVFNCLLVVPFQLHQINHLITAHSAQIPAPQRPGRNVYFIHGGGFYIWDLAQIDPLLRSEDLILASRGPVLDAELRRQNWPGAVKIGESRALEQWTIDAQPPDDRFTLTFVPPALSQQP